jgi:hypothetical protein
VWTISNKEAHNCESVLAITINLKMEEDENGGVVRGLAIPGGVRVRTLCLRLVRCGGETVRTVMLYTWGVRLPNW